MEEWGHVTTMREVDRGEDCSVRSWRVIEGGIEGKRGEEKQVDSNELPHVGEQSGSKGSVLLR